MELYITLYTHLPYPRTHQLPLRRNTSCTYPLLSSRQCLASGLCLLLTGILQWLTPFDLFAISFSPLQSVFYMRASLFHPKNKQAHAIHPAEIPLWVSFSFQNLILTYFSSCISHIHQHKR